MNESDEAKIERYRGACRIEGALAAAAEMLAGIPTALRRYRLPDEHAEAAIERVASALYELRPFTAPHDPDDDEDPREVGYP